MLKNILSLLVFLSTTIFSQDASEIAPDGKPWIKSDIPLWKTNNPNLETTWSWQQETYIVYWDKFANNPVEVTSPFYSEITGGVAFTHDFEPIDGWVLVYRNFGSSTGSIKCPYFILYNKYEGLLRTFILVNSTQNYSHATVSLFFDPTLTNTTALLTHASNRAWAVDNYIVDNVSVAVTDMFDGHWLYVDYATAYDPGTQNISDSAIRFDFDGVDLTQVNLNGTLNLVQELPKSSFPDENSNLQNLIVAGKSVAGYYNTFEKWKTEIPKAAAKQTNPELKSALEHLATTWTYDDLSLIGAAVGIVDFFISGGRTDKKESPVPIVFNGDMELSGTLQQEEDVIAFSIQTPGTIHNSPNFLPLYDYPLGIFNLVETPILLSRYYWQQTSPGNSMLYSSYKIKNDLVYAINPNSELELNNMSVALVFRLDPVYPYPFSYLYGINDWIDRGIYEFESSTDGNYVLRTNYIPYEDFKDNVITVPPGTDVTIKIKAVLEKNYCAGSCHGTPPQPVLFIADYEPIFEQVSGNSAFSFSPNQIPPLSAYITGPDPVNSNGGDIFTVYPKGGGTGPYTYRWYQSDGGGPPRYLGTAKTATLLAPNSGTSVKIYCYVTEGTNEIEVTKSVMIDPGTGGCGECHDDMEDSKLNKIASGINYHQKELSSEIPNKYHLYANYPNPFNPITKISFSLPIDSHVKLKVYSLNGKLVKEIINEFQIAGNYTVSFDGSNLSSGVYLYIIDTGSFRHVRKMMLIK